MSFLKSAVLAVSLSFAALSAHAEPFVHNVKITIAPEKLEQFKPLLVAELNEAVRTEPDFLAVYASQDKAQPNQIYLFEIFTSKQAMDSYQAKPRFQAFLKRAMPMLQAHEEVLLTPLSFQTQSNLLEQTK